MNICVYGASSTALAPSYLEAGEDFGYRMAKRGHTLIFGAGANGMMGAVARGCTRGNAQIIGIVPHYFDGDGILYDRCTDIIETETMRSRKAILDARSDAFVMVPGGVGTFDEFFEILTLRQLGQLAKPIAIYNINGYFDPMFQMLDFAVKEKFMKQATCELYAVFTDPEALLDYVENHDAQNPDKETVKYV